MILMAMHEMSMGTECLGLRSKVRTRSGFTILAVAHDER